MLLFAGSKLITQNSFGMKMQLHWIHFYSKILGLHYFMKYSIDNSNRNPKKVFVCQIDHVSRNKLNIIINECSSSKTII